MEYLNGGSLVNLLGSVGALPENILLDITHSVLHSLNFIHNKAKIGHNGLSMSHIMFDREGRIKVNPFTSQDPNSPARKNKVNLFQEMSQSELTEDTERIKNEGFAQDVFDLGYILLI